MIIYTFNVDADKKEGGQVYRVPFFEPIPGPWMSLEGKEEQLFIKMVKRHLYRVHFRTYLG